MLNPSVFSDLKNDLETRAFLFFCIFFCLAFQSLSYFSLWTETEIYPVHSSQYLFTENMMSFLFSLKPIFYSVLHLSSLFSNALELFPMTGARLLFALNGLGILALMYLYIKKKTNKYNAVLAVLLLASSNIFLDRGFRVRSDFLSTSFSLIALLLTLNIQNQKDHWRFYFVIPFLLSTLLISPKGIYWLFFTVCLILYDLKNKTPSRWLIIKTVFAVYLVFYFLSFLFKDPFFIKSIYQSAKFYLSDISRAFQFTSEHSWIKNLSDFSHFAIFAKRNLILMILILTKLLFVIYSTVIAKKRKWDLSDLYFFLLLTVLLFHPQQKLFFLCAIMPFILIAFFTDWQWKQLINHSYGLKFKTLLLAGVFLYSVSHIFYFSYTMHIKKNNRAQKHLVEKLNTFYKHTDPITAIFDPSCILYVRKTDCRYILYDKTWKKVFKSYLKEQNFDIILASRFLNLFELTHYKQSSFQYINVRNNIYYKALIFNLNDQKELLKIAEHKESSLFTHTQSGDSGGKLQSLQVNEDQTKTNVLSGEKSIQTLLSSLETKVPEETRLYSYLFLNDKNKAIKNTIDCRKTKEEPFILQEGCPYSKEEFKKGRIPIKNKKMALFYLPLPLNLPKEPPIIALFRYDMY